MSRRKDAIDESVREIDRATARDAARTRRDRVAQDRNAALEDEHDGEDRAMRRRRFQRLAHADDPAHAERIDHHFDALQSQILRDRAATQNTPEPEPGTDFDAGKGTVLPAPWQPTWADPDGFGR